MQIQTKYFGELTIDPAKIITFKYKISPAHPSSRWALVAHHELAPFAFLQSLDDPADWLFVTEPATWCSGYEPALGDEVSRLIGLGPDSAGLLLLAIVSVHRRKLVMDLVRPLVINTAAGGGAVGIAAECATTEGWSEAFPIDLELIDGGENESEAA